MLKLTPTWCGPLTTPGVLNLTPEFLQCNCTDYQFVYAIYAVNTCADSAEVVLSKQRYLLNRDIIYFRSRGIMGKAGGYRPILF